MCLHEKTAAPGRLLIQLMLVSCCSFRDGRQEKVHFDKITARIQKLSYGLNSEFCDPVSDESQED